MRRTRPQGHQRQRPVAAPQGKYHVDANTTREADLATVDRALAELQGMFGQPVDIHTFTRPIGAICNQVFLPLDEKYGLSQATQAAFEQTATEIMALANTQRDPVKVQTVINSIRDFRDRQDGETKQHVMTLLVKTWELAKKVPFTNARDLVLDNLRHNKDTGGGCYPGIAARLVQPYSAFLNAMLQDQTLVAKPVEQAQPAKVDDENDDEDVLLNAAIAASLVPQQPPVVPQRNNFDAQLAEALRLSREEAEKRERQEQEARDAQLALELHQRLNT